MISLNKVLNTLWEGVSDREKEVLAGRFGVGKSTEPQTLAALGERYNVTRERIRQIESSGLEVLKENIAKDASCTELVNKTKKFISNSGGVLHKEKLYSYAVSLVPGITENQLGLILEASGAFKSYEEDKDFNSFYYSDKSNFKLASTFIDRWGSFLKSKKKEILAGDYNSHLKGFLKKNGVEENHATTYLAVSKKIGRNPYGDVGLAEWPEINPKTVRDRVYLVLSKKKTPLHFENIASTINEVGFNGRKASAPTVHNELIKDGRFVLVGRGTYALREHGYEPGTAREVIQRILKKHGSLKPKDLLLAVQKERFLKPNTILVNLQNKSFFKRLPDGTYQVRES